MIANTHIARDPAVVELVAEIREAIEPATTKQLADWAVKTAYQEAARLERLDALSPGFSDAYHSHQRWRSVAKVFGTLCDLEVFAAMEAAKTKEAR